VWDPLEADWQDMYAQLEEYRREEGHCRVPVKYEDSPALGLWVGTQRTAYHQGKLDDERAALLEALGFVWDPLEADWQDMYAQLEEYRREEGHCRVPVKYEDSPALGLWV